MRNASNLRTFCFKDHHYELFCLSRDSYVLCHSLIRSSYFIQAYVFIHLIHPAPFLRFSHILLTPIFFICLLPCEYISFLWWCRWSEKARNLILIFNFSGRRVTWSIFYFLTFVVLNFHKIYVLTCSNLPTKLQAICCHFWIELKEPKHAKERIKKDSNRYFVETSWKFWTKAKFKL